MLKQKIKQGLSYFFIFSLTLFIISAYFFISLFTWKDAILFIILIILFLYFYSNYKKEVNSNNSQQNLYAFSFFISILISKLFLGVYKQGHSFSRIAYNIFNLSFLFIIACIVVGNIYCGQLKNKMQKKNSYEIAIIFVLCFFIFVDILIYRFKILVPPKILIGKIYAPAIFLPILLFLFFPSFFSNVLRFSAISRYKIIMLTTFFSITAGVSIVRAAFSLVHYRRGEDYERNNELIDAINEYKLAFYYNPLFLAARLNLAKAYEENNNLAEAITEYGSIIRETMDASAHFFSGKIYERMGKSDLAFTQYQSVKKKNRYFKDAQIHMAQLYIAQKKWQRALECLNYFKEEADFQQLEFAEAGDSFDFASLLYNKNKRDEALYFFKHAIELQKDKSVISPMFYYNLARTYYDLKDPSSARYYFEKAKENEPLNVSTLNFLKILEVNSPESKQLLQEEIDAILSGYQSITINALEDPQKVHSEYIFEAEDLSHHSGVVVFEEDASAGKVWYANQKTDDKASFMVFGPAIVMPFGEYKAYFRLKSNGIVDSNLQICGIDVVGTNENNVILYLASRPIVSREFTSDKTYKDFELDFHNSGNLFLQFRIQFMDQEVWADRIAVLPDVN
jgi:tetratricopeptide (TPR) repeat protein